MSLSKATMTPRAELSLRFKGGRDYLHGTDIWNTTAEWLTSVLNGEQLTDFDISFHALARRQLSIVLTSDSVGSEPVSICSFRSNGIRRRATLFETGATVNGRYPYDEARVVRDFYIEAPARKGIIRSKVAVTDIELWVAATKALHQRVYSSLPGKWLFVRGRFPRYTERSDYGECLIRIAAVLGDKLTRNEVLLDNTKVGEIFFSIA